MVVLTSFGDRDTVVRTIEAGADGYLLKDSANLEIVDAVEAALTGGAPISAAAILSRGAEYCDIQGYSYSQPHIGGTFSTAQASFNGAETYGTHIPCSCVG